MFPKSSVVIPDGFQNSLFPIPCFPQIFDSFNLNSAIHYIIRSFEIHNRLLRSYYSRFDELKAIILYIGNNIGNWFTCIKYEGIEPTNNFAEQALRETVIVRRIIGAFRSENGKQNYETLASLLSSWQLNNFDIKERLKSMQIKNLCFC